MKVTRYAAPQPEGSRQRFCSRHPAVRAVATILEGQWARPACERCVKEASPCEGDCGRKGKRYAGGVWCCVQCMRWGQHTVFCDKREAA